MIMSLPMLRRAGLVLAVSAFALAGLALTDLARADDPPQPRNEAAAPAGQKGGRGGNAAQASPAAADQHRLPGDQTTKQTLDLPGRTLNFAATAGSVRVFDEKGSRSPTSPPRLTSWTVPIAPRVP